jgi:hypothetical protein
MLSMSSKCICRRRIRIASTNASVCTPTMYLRVFNGVVDFEFTPVERWATPERVFDDSYASFKITGDAFENCPYPIGTKVQMRLIHNFHIEDGLISREIGYEVWRRAD